MVNYVKLDKGLIKATDLPVVNAVVDYLHSLEAKVQLCGSVTGEKSVHKTVPAEYATPEAVAKHDARLAVDHPPRQYSDVDMLVSGVKFDRWKLIGDLFKATRGEDNYFTQNGFDVENVTPKGVKPVGAVFRYAGTQLDQRFTITKGETTIDLSIESIFDRTFISEYINQPSTGPWDREEYPNLRELLPKNVVADLQSPSSTPKFSDEYRIKLLGALISNLPKKNK